jgi:hypothetical protein
VADFLRRLTFSVLLGDNDAHAKNLGILHLPGRRGPLRRNLSYERDARPRRPSAGYLVTEKVEQFKPWTEPFIEFACGVGALRPTIS